MILSQSLSRFEPIRKPESNINLDFRCHTRRDSLFKGKNFVFLTKLQMDVISEFVIRCGGNCFLFEGTSFDSFVESFAELKDFAIVNPPSGVSKIVETFHQHDLLTIEDALLRYVILDPEHNAIQFNPFVSPRPRPERDLSPCLEEQLSQAPSQSPLLSRSISLLDKEKEGSDELPLRDSSMQRSLLRRNENLMKKSLDPVKQESEDIVPVLLKDDVIEIKRNLFRTVCRKDKEPRQSSDIPNFKRFKRKGEKSLGKEKPPVTRTRCTFGIASCTEKKSELLLEEAKKSSLDAMLHESELRFPLKIPTIGRRRK